MGRAAQDEAAGGHAALAAEYATDPATMERVLAALSEHTPAVDVLSRHHQLAMPADTLERRTRTLLHSTRGAL